MNWAIKDEYFEKVYGKSYKPKEVKKNAKTTTGNAEWGETVRGRQPTPDLPKQEGKGSGGQDSVYGD